jgi:hypothetical protein
MGSNAYLLSKCLIWSTQMMIGQNKEKAQIDRFVETARKLGHAC